jgi:hypothetical protein
VRSYEFTQICIPGLLSLVSEDSISKSGGDFTQTCIPGLLSLVSKDSKILNLGAIWNCSKGTGLSLNLVSAYGAQEGLLLRYRCIGTERAPTQILF